MECRAWNAITAFVFEKCRFRIAATNFGCVSQNECNNAVKTHQTPVFCWKALQKFLSFSLSLSPRMFVCHLSSVSNRLQGFCDYLIWTVWDQSPRTMFKSKQCKFQLICNQQVWLFLCMLCMAKSRQITPTLRQYTRSIYFNSHSDTSQWRHDGAPPIPSFHWAETDLWLGEEHRQKTLWKIRNFTYLRQKNQLLAVIHTICKTIIIICANKGSYCVIWS